MKEMFKSKFLILFVVFVLGVTYFNSIGMQKFNTENVNESDLILNK